MGDQQEKPHHPNPKSGSGTKVITGHQVAKLEFGHRQQYRQQGKEPQTTQVNAGDDDREQNNGCECACT